MQRYTYKNSPAELIAQKITYLPAPTNISQLILDKAGVVAHAIWIAWLSNKSDFKVTPEMIAQRVHVSVRQAQNALAKLASLGLARLNTIRDSVGRFLGKYWAVYMLPAHDETDQSPHKTPTGRFTTCGQTTSEVLPELNKTNTKINTKTTPESPPNNPPNHCSNNDQKEKAKHTGGDRNQLIDEIFTDLFDFYPKRTESDRPESLKAFKYVTKNIPTPDLEIFSIMLISDVFLRQSECHSWRELRFIPSLKNYLFGAVWEKPVTPKQKLRESAHRTLREDLTDKSWAYGVSTSQNVPQADILAIEHIPSRQNSDTSRDWAL
jgi:hypothetical protein